MNVVSFNGLLTDEQLKSVEALLNVSGVLEVNRIDSKIYNYPALKVIESGHAELKGLGSFRISSLLRKVETSSFNIDTGLDFKTGLHLIRYLKLL